MTFRSAYFASAYWSTMSGKSKASASLSAAAPIRDSWATGVPTADSNDLKYGVPTGVPDWVPAECESPSKIQELATEVSPYSLTILALTRSLVSSSTFCWSARLSSGLGGSGAGQNRSSEKHVFRKEYSCQAACCRVAKKYQKKNRWGTHVLRVS